MFNFVADDLPEEAIIVPFLEDARADFAPFYSSSKTIKQAQSEIEKHLAKLGASVTNFVSGRFPDGEKTRFGYLINFRMKGVDGRIVVAALPIRRYTSTKEKQARVQALLNVSQWLQTQITQQVFSPGSNPLVPYLLAADGKTIMQHILSSKAIPQLSAPEDAVEMES
jgi:hypothetical protein